MYSHIHLIILSFTVLYLIISYNELLLKTWLFFGILTINLSLNSAS